MTLNTHEPRSVTVIRHVMEYLLSRSISQESYADDVVKIYHSRIPDVKARVMRFHEGGDVAKDLAANAQLVMRLINRRVKMPADVEEALVLALPEEYRQPLLRDLSERYDLLAAPIPHDSVTDNLSSISRLMKETGEAIESLAPILADGKIDENDRSYAKNALTQINEAMAELVGWQSRITKILPDDNVTEFPTKQM